MGGSADAAMLQTVVVGAVNLVFTVVAIFTVDRYGRKSLMLIGGVGMAVAMLGLGLSFYASWHWSSTLGFMLFYVACFAMSWGPVAWVLLSEMFPNKIRAAAMAIAVAAMWIANQIVSWTFPMMNDNTWLVDTFNHGFYWVYGTAAWSLSSSYGASSPRPRGRPKSWSNSGSKARRVCPMGPSSSPARSAAE